MAGEPLPAATLVVVRDGAPGLEVLLLERMPREEGKSSPWVFPGGRVEEGDREGEDPVAHARRAAVRETHEEAGLDLAGAELDLISRWITPKLGTRRFDTWFFLTHLEHAAEVRVDGSEIRSHRWLRPATALEAFHAGELRLAPPTFVTVTWLSQHEAAAPARRALADAPLVTFRPYIRPVPGGACILYPGDDGYESGDIEGPGARHRLWTTPEGWRYERSSA